MLGKGAHVNIGLIVPHATWPGRRLLEGEEEDHAAHRKDRAPTPGTRCGPCASYGAEFPV